MNNLIFRYRLGIVLLFLLFGVANGFAETSTHSLDQAKSRLSSGDSLLAEKLYRTYLREQKGEDNESEAMLGLGISMLKNGRVEESVTQFLELAQKYPHSSSALEAAYWRGIARFSLGQMGQSLILFRDFIDTVEANASLEAFYLAKGLNFENEEVFEDTKKVSDPFSLNLVNEAYIYLIWSYHKLGQTNETVELLDRYYEKGFSIWHNYPIFSLTAMLYVKNNKSAEFLKFTSTGGNASFSEIEQSYVDLYNAEAFTDVKGVDVGLPLFLSLIEQYKQTQTGALIFSWKTLFTVYENRGDWDLLSSCCRDAVESLGSSNVEVRKMIIRASSLLLKTSRYNEVVELTDFLIEENPLDSECWIYRLKAIQKNPAEEKKLSIQEILPPGLLDSLSSDSKGGDYLLVQLSREATLERRWESGVKFADRMIKLYPDSTYYNQALYFSVYSKMKLWDFELALTRIRGEKKSSLSQPENLRFMKLEAHCLRMLKRHKEALIVFSRIVEQESSEKNLLQSALTAFQAQEYEILNEFTSQLLEMQKAGELSIQLGFYFRGLSKISLKEYSSALKDLNQVRESVFNNGNLTAVIPWLSYYRGWCSYRLGHYGDAVAQFDIMINRFPQHQLYLPSLRLSGWAALSGGDYAHASNSFKLFSEKSNREDRDEARFLYGRALAMFGDEEGAEDVLMALSTDRGSDFADDALFELALFYNQIQSYQEASRLFLQLSKDFPASDLAEESFFSSADSLFYAADYKKAALRYSDYRKKYPKGFNYQAALFRGASAWRKMADNGGALFLYQRLYDDFSNGPYASEALIYMAEIATDKKEWENSAAFYRELQNRFPSDARAVNAAKRLKSLFFRAQGRDSREADLLVQLDKQGGVETRKGRKAALELADLYLNLYRSEENREKALGWLESVISLQKKDADSAAEAWRLKGDDAFRKGDYENSLSFFVESAAASTQRDFSASVLYRAILAALEAGFQKDAVSIYRSMEKQFPKSEWLGKSAGLPGFPDLSQVEGVSDE